MSEGFYFRSGIAMGRIGPAPASDASSSGTGSVLWDTRRMRRVSEGCETEEGHRIRLGILCLALQITLPIDGYLIICPIGLSLFTNLYQLDSFWTP